VPALDLRSDEVAAGEPPARSPSRRRDPAAIIAVVATIATLIPALTVIAKFAFRDVLLTGDFGIIDTRVRDVWSGPIPLLGPYSFGWNHPGPLYYYALAPLDLLGRGAAWTVVIGGVLIQSVAVGLGARLAWRRGGLGLTLLVLATFSLSWLGASDRVLLDPWNPHVAMPFLVLFVLQIWSVTLGDRWQLLGAAIVASFLVQTHVGYVPLVGIGLALAGAMVIADTVRRHRPWGPWRTPALVSIGVTLVLWLPPLIEQLTDHPGNVTLMLRYARDKPEGVIGYRAGAGTFAAQFHPLPTWLGGAEKLVPLTFQPRPESLWWLLVPVGLLVLSIVVAVRRRLGAELRLVVLVGTLAVAGTLALSQVKTAAWSYMSLWRIPLAILVVAVSAWTLWRAVADPPQLARTAGIGVLGIAILGGVVPITRDILDTAHVASFHDDVAAVVDQIDTSKVHGTVLVRNVAPALRGVAPTLIDELDRDGVAVRVDPRSGPAWDESRVALPSEVDHVWIVTEDGTRGSLLRASPGARVLAHTSPLPAAQERELSRLQRDLALQLFDVGRGDLVQFLEYPDFVPLLKIQAPELDAAAVDRVARLVQRSAAIGGCRCTVIAFAPDRLPPLTDG
jgi:hypothetical protein